MLSTRLSASLFTAALVSVSCTSATVEDSAISTTPPSTVQDPVAETNEGVQSIAVGIVLNTANTGSASADRDEDFAAVAETTATSLNASSDIELRLEIATIDGVSGVASAIDDLTSRGITALVTSCDDSTLPAVVDTAIEQELLVVTGCVAIPQPELSTDSLLIDLADLSDSANRIVDWLVDGDLGQIATVTSTLIPDVAQTCVDLESETEERITGNVVAAVEFVELVDPVENIALELAPQQDMIEAIAICALPPAIGDVTSALRSAGFDQPVIVPWYGDPQEWAASVDDVFVFAPASRFGDDPASDVVELFAEIDDPEPADVVVADSLSALVQAVEIADSAASRRVAAALRDGDFDGTSGTLSVDTSRPSPVYRSYRVLEVINGEPQFSELIGPS